MIFVHNKATYHIAHQNPWTPTMIQGRDEAARQQQQLHVHPGKKYISCGIGPACAGAGINYLDAYERDRFGLSWDLGRTYCSSVYWINQRDGARPPECPTEKILRASFAVSSAVALQFCSLLQSKVGELLKLVITVRGAVPCMVIEQCS